MRRFILRKQHKRLARIAFIVHPVDRHVRNNIGRITLDRLGAFCRTENRIVISALPAVTAKDLPVTKLIRRLRAHVPFAEQCRLVALFFKQAGKDHLLSVPGCTVVSNAVEVAVFAGQNARPTRLTDRVRAETIREYRTLFGDTVDIRSLIDSAAVRTDGIIRVVVAEYEKDVRPPGLFRASGTDVITAWRCHQTRRNTPADLQKLTTPNL